MTIGMYVIGVAMHPAQVKVADKRLEEMVYDTARACLDGAGIERRQLDHVTIAGCDELDGRSISSMLLAAPSGAYLKDELKATDSGMHGLCLEATRLGSGRFDLGLVVSWCKTSTAPLEDVMRMRCDPFFTRPIGLNMGIADGLLARASAESIGCTEAQAAAAAAAYLRQAARNPRGTRPPPVSPEQLLASAYVAAPLRAGHQAPLTDGAVALLMASERWLEANSNVRPLARMSGIAWRVDSYQLGARRLSSLDAVRGAFAAASRQAGIDDAAPLDVIELEAQTGYHDLALRHALAIADSVAVSPSGGPFAQNPYFCTGLVGAAEAVMQVANRAGPVQVPGARRAAAVGLCGFAAQSAAVAIFEGA